MLPLESFYLEYLNNFLTVEKYAAWLGMATDDVSAILDICRKNRD